MKLSHATLYLLTSATFAIGALGLQGCSDSTPATGDASPTMDSAVAEASTDSAQESSSDASPLKDSAQESSADAATESAADAVADTTGDSPIVLPMDGATDVSVPSDASPLADGSADSSDARVE